MRSLTKKAAGIESGGKKTNWFGSGLDRVAALPVAGPDGNNRKLHLPAQSSRKEAAHRMRLPSGCLHDLVQAGPARALDQAEDRLGLARCAQAFLPRRFSGLGGFGLRGGPGSRFGRVLYRSGPPGSLRSRGRHTGLPCAGTDPLRGRSKCLGSTAHGSFVGFCNQFTHVHSPCAALAAVITFIALVAGTGKAILRLIRGRRGSAMVLSTGTSAGVRQ